MSAPQLIAYLVIVARISCNRWALQYELTDFLLHRHDGEQVFDETLALGGVIGAAAGHDSPASHAVVNIPFG